MVFLGIGIGAAIIAVGGASYWLVRNRMNHTPGKDSPNASEKPGAVKSPQKAAQAKTSPRVKELSSLPDSARSRLVNAVWYRCENPYCNRSNFLEVHQIVSEVEGGTNRLDNLVVLCSDCHRLADNNEIPVNVMKSWITQKKDRFRDNLDWQYR